MKKTELSRLVAVFLGSSIFTGFVGLSGVAQGAFWTRSGPADCVELAGNNTSIFAPGCNELTANSKLLECNITDTSATPKTGITTLNVHIEEFSGSIASSSRCVRFWNATGGTCGGGVNTPSNGVTGISPPTFATWDTGNFGFISVILPPKTGAGNSCLKGIFTAG
jgi:hypothetical protein